MTIPGVQYNTALYICQICAARISSKRWGRNLENLLSESFRQYQKLVSISFFHLVRSLTKHHYSQHIPQNLKYLGNAPEESISKVVNSGNLFKTSKLEWVNTAPVQKYLVLVFVFGQRFLKKISQFYSTIEHKHIPYFIISTGAQSPLRMRQKSEM